MAATHMNLPMGAVYEWQPGADWEQVQEVKVQGQMG
ncbi:MAG: hypothetical protein CM1200mP40_20620 [Gammaproteobacteria bacterium]|nr:MAG: hypothetical protein CM1200mP40_20620 [Gammaproteobacteria bacterium]